MLYVKPNSTSVQIRPQDVVGAPCGPKLRACPPVSWWAGAGKGADAEKVTRGLGLARRSKETVLFGKMLVINLLKFVKIIFNTLVIL